MDQEIEQYYQYSYPQQYDENDEKKIEQEMDKIIQQSNNIIDEEWLNTLNLMKVSVLKLFRVQPKIPLVMNKQQSITLTREQAFSFLSLLYFGLTKKQEEHYKFNVFQNMNEIRDSKNNLSLQKMDCFKGYLNWYYKNQDLRKLESIKMTKLKHNKYRQIQDWQNSNVQIANIEMNNTSMFDHNQEEGILVDFADPYIGGLTLEKQNCAQEEVIMCLHPEAILASLFFKKLQQDEAIYFENVMKTADFEGYENTFKYREPNQFKNSNIIAIDAYPFGGVENQFDSYWINRELNKAFIGFSLYQDAVGRKLNIISGKWGCGIFRGDILLKTFIQIAAFSEAVSNLKEERPKLILSFYEDREFEKYQQIVTTVIRQQKTVGNLVKKMTEIKLSNSRM